MTKEGLLSKIEEKLKNIYKEEYKDSFINEIDNLIKKWENADWGKNTPVSQKNVYLITYGDSIYEENTPTLRTLNKFIKDNIGERITDVHLLPMFDYTSDDGFSVVDYRKIDEKLGDWKDIHSFSKDYRMMYDFVANHMSKSSEWFKGYLKEDEKYREFFIPEDECFDTSKVVRPRTSPLFHEYEGKNGVKTAWTTFSEDQVDLNFKSFSVMIEMSDIILMYANRGASSIRLDAIGFLWKESGTTCMHLLQTHEVIKIWRLLLDYFKLNTQIITETNVPHKENISYFGDGSDEAHMVYQFALPPLVLFTFTTHNSEKLTAWAKTIGRVSQDATFFNFLASHDGIGIRPTEGILTNEERNVLVNKVIENDGKISYKNNADGTKSVYELNINYHDALINRNEDTSLDLQVKKMIAAHSMLLSFVGVPAIYYNSLIGSRNDYEGLEESGINRRINREKFEFSTIVKELKSDKRRSMIFNGLKEIIKIRQGESAFSPFASQKVIELNNSLFALIRENKDTNESIAYIVNTTSKEQAVNMELSGTDLITGRKIDREICLEPYGFMWVKLNQ